jgi:hypothetical protein
MNDEFDHDYDNIQAPVVAPRMSPKMTDMAPAMPEIAVTQDMAQPINVVDDSEIKMAQAQLYRAAKNSLELHKMCKFVDELEGWCQAKITIAAENLEAVKNYIEYEMVSATLAESMKEDKLVGSSPIDRQTTLAMDTKSKKIGELTRKFMNAGHDRVKAGELALLCIDAKVC